MQTKTYFASSVRAAMDLATRELGPDAMLLNSGPAPEGARSLGRLEVTFAWDPASQVPSARPEPVSRHREPGLDDIRLEISALRAAIGQQGILPRQTGTEPAADADSAVVGELCGAGVDLDVARDIAAAASRAGGRMGDSVVNELTIRLAVVRWKPLQPDENRTLAMIGPSGRGKTSSLVKIAVRYGLANRIPTKIYFAGSHGVGATEQMARYAAILGVPFQAMESFESLSLALSGERWNGLILIDTPGLSAADRRELDEMTRFFSRHSEIERHLVLRAEAHSADMRHTVAQFAVMQPTRLLFTGVDEVRGLGAAAGTMIRSGIAATFFGTGRCIPDDLKEVDGTKLARTLWMSNQRAAAA